MILTVEYSNWTGRLVVCEDSTNSTALPKTTASKVKSYEGTGPARMLLALLVLEWTILEARPTSRTINTSPIALIIAEQSALYTTIE